MRLSRTHAALVALGLACAVACSLRSLDYLDAANSSRGYEGEGGTPSAGEGGETGSGGTWSSGGSSTGGASGRGGSDVGGAGGSGASAGSGATGGTPQGGSAGQSSGGWSGGGAGAESGGSSGGGAGAGGTSGAGSGGGAGAGAAGGGAGGAGGTGTGGRGPDCSRLAAGCPLHDETPYVVRPGHAPDKCIDVPGYDVNAGARLQEWSCFFQANQVFWAEDHGRGRFALRNALSAKCLEVVSASLDAGAAIAQGTCSGAAHQLWRPVADGDRFRLLSDQSRLVLDVSGAELTADGTPLVQNAPDDLADSTWTFEEASRGAFAVLNVPGQPGTRATRVTGALRVTASTGPETHWKVHPGLGNASCVSFESTQASGTFLRHIGRELRFEPTDTSTSFARDATFCLRAPLDGTHVVLHSIESENEPGNFLSREGETVVLGAFEDTSTFRAAATWATREP